jgi:hypothetical protein
MFAKILYVTLLAASLWSNSIWAQAPTMYTKESLHERLHNHFRSEAVFGKLKETEYYEDGKIVESKNPRGSCKVFLYTAHPHNYLFYSLHFWKNELSGVGNGFMNGNTRGETYAVQHLSPNSREEQLLVEGNRSMNINIRVLFENGVITAVTFDERSVARGFSLSVDGNGRAIVRRTRECLYK